MKNYIKVNGKKIELTEEQIREIVESCTAKKGVKLSEKAVGETCKIGKYEFIVLEHSKETTAVILKDLLFNDKRFGNNNNYNGSNVDDLCNKFAEEIEGIVGKNNLVKHSVDLTSDDGLKCYGKVTRKASLLTTNLYRRYVDILDKYKIDKWWWLATAYSTPTHGDKDIVKCVSPRGSIFNLNYNFGSGVRPFCIFDSNIFVS